MLLEQGDRCWRVAEAGRAALLIDGQAYYEAALEAMIQARRSIYFLNWAFEPGTHFRPTPDGDGEGAENIADFLKRLTTERPELDVRVLCWESALPVAATQRFFPIADREVFAGSRVKFSLDGKLPMAACHHQKVIVVDDNLAFCGGADIGQDRWDTPRHLDDDPRRKTGKRGHAYFPSRHEVMAVVDGAPAQALGELFRRRWLRHSGEALEAPSPPPAPWPAGAPPMFDRIRVGLSRTEPAWRGVPAVRENEALHLAAISAARRCIYMENQYFTSELMAMALARRLAEPDGPEVVLVSGGRSPSYFDRMTMDPTRSRFIERLKAADRHGRFRIYSPVTTLGRDIIVHAKLTIIDDELIRIGSANLDNRSFGFDTECDLSLEADGPSAADARTTIAGLRVRLLGHWLGCGSEVVEAAIETQDSLGLAIDSLREAGYCRLRPISTMNLNPLSALIARLHIGDPMSPSDSFRPWRRREALEARLRAWSGGNPPPGADDPTPAATANPSAS